MLNELSKEIHKNNKEKGFYESEKNIGEMLALIHSEVSEALECDRKGKYASRFLSAERKTVEGEEPTTLYALTARVDGDKFKDFFEKTYKDTFEDELADILIRVLDLAAFKGIDIDSHVLAKIRYNTLRPYKHGKKY